MIIIGIDPGNVTGMAVWNSHRAKLSVREIEKSTDVSVHLGRLLHDTTRRGGPIRVACERFTEMPGRRAKTAQPTAQKVCGMVEATCAIYGIKLIYQSPGDAKKIAPFKMLKKIGWWNPTKDMHQVNATQHILMCVATEWPDIFAELVGI
jgi:hypothetical protein